jgi:phosphoglycolate phosphatase
VAGDSLPTRKPDAAPLLHCFDILGSSNGRRLYVGDSEVDVETAVNAKVDMALFTEGYRHTPTGELVHAYNFDHFSDFGAIAADHFS